MNHFSLDICMCGYSTYSHKWMKKHMSKKHDENGVFSFAKITGNNK